MTDEILQEIACPNCRNPIDIRQRGNLITCEACRSQFVLQGHVCPTCSAYHPQEQGFCRECGTALTRICRKCNTGNWTGDEFCRQCGQALDIFEYLHIKGSADTAERLNQQMAWSRQIKVKEAEDAEKRMADLMAIEEERQQQLQLMRAQQKKEDRMLLVFGGLGLMVLIISIVFYVLFQLLS